MATLEQVFNHVVLPPELPGKEDENADEIGSALLVRLRNACDVLNEVTGPDFSAGWRAMDSTLDTSQRILGGNLTAQILLPAFAQLGQKDGFVVLHIREQNAALLMYRRDQKDQKDDPDSAHVVFEAFETSPRLQDVVAAQDALRWDFPARAVQVPLNDVLDVLDDRTDLQHCLAVFLEKADAEPLAHLAQKASKSGASVTEIRDVVRPDLITHLLLSVLQAVGGAAEVPRLEKRVRDDVHLNGGTLPWRRLPFWLVLRVAAQRRMAVLHGAGVGYAAYKILTCAVLSGLLQDCVEQQMHPARVVLLQKKLGRKLAKLETWEKREKREKLPSIQHLLDSTSPLFARSIDSATAYVNRAFAEFKHESIRRIPTLPRRAADGHLRLTLPTSGRAMDDLLLPPDRRHGPWTSQTARATEHDLLANLNSLPAIQNVSAFTKNVVEAVAEMEQSELQCARARPDGTGPGRPPDGLATCKAAEQAIFSLLARVAPAGIDHVALNSAVLLEIFDQWLLLDEACVALHPLLGAYSPVFPAALLDVLQLPDVAAVRRLRRIQRYLADRHGASSMAGQTIFSAGATCFGTQFARASAEHTALYGTIVAAQERQREAKTRQLERLCDEYDEKTRQIDANECTCYYDGGQRQVSGCVRCYKWRVRKRMKVDVWEDLLPGDAAAAQAIVFELSVPEAIAVYRHATWAMVTRLAHPRRPALEKAEKAKKAKQVEKLCNAAVSGYRAADHASTVTLASSVESFRNTHYKTVKMKATLSDVLLPLAARFRLYDTALGCFIDEFTEPLTLAHLCHVHVPEPLRQTVLARPQHPPTAPAGPTSYQCVASRAQCPPTMSAHEFEAYQRLLSGKARRWLTMLVELGSSNVNFGKEDALLVFCSLAHEAGPLGDDDDDDDDDDDRDLGTCHAFFGDDGFVERLLTELAKRLRSIHGNWRETNMMGLVITLLLRADTLVASPAHRGRLASLLRLARSTTLAWLHVLQHEVMSADSSDASKRASRYRFRAALLCRQTFTPLARDADLAMSGPDLAEFVQASIALQQNLDMDASALEATEKACLRGDTMMACRLRDKVLAAVRQAPDSLSAGIKHAIGLADPSSVSASSALDPLFGPWTVLTGTSDGWVTSSLSTQCFTYHLTQGHLLIDGKTVGKLPDNIRASDEVKVLFGDRYLLAYPSALAGMSHRLAARVHGHIVHVGMHGDTVVVLSVDRRSAICEFVPRRVFVDAHGTYDLPRRLVDHCFHWANRTTGCLEIRQESPWETRPSDWNLDIRSRQARRGNVVLVDPFSDTAGLVAQVFRGFEDVQRLTIFQPDSPSPDRPDSRLSAELRHLELSFAVTRHGTLECRELAAEVDPDQDAGTLYGYQSMIVLRDRLDHARRSILVPLGELVWTRHGCHIALLAKRDSTADGGRGKAYARFDVDATLGRLTCAPEPRLLYTKAQLHAFTSGPLPDPLTGRTGEEEAVHTLRAARCQPWTHLPPVCLAILGQIMKLVPVRAYHPKDMRVLQQVTWDRHLPVGMQSDRYGRIIRGIVATASDLRRFEEPVKMVKTGASDDVQRAYDGLLAPDTHLQVRGEVQRLRYECPRDDVEPDCPVRAVDKAYSSSGRLTVENDCPCKACAVFQVASAVCRRPPTVAMKQDIAAVLDRWPIIGGHGSPLKADFVPISAMMESRLVSEQWGNLVELCRHADTRSTHQVTFTLAALAFAADANMDAIRLLAACSYMPALRSIEPPAHDAFSGFRYMEEMTAAALLSLIEGAYTPYVAENIAETGWETVQRIMDEQRAAHLARCRKEGKRLAKHLLAAWPDHDRPAPAVDAALIDVDAALKSIDGLWERLLHNRDLSLYVAALQEAVDKVRVRPPKATAAHTLETRLLPRQNVVPSLSRDLVAMPVDLDEGHQTLQPAAAAAPSQDPVESLPDAFTELAHIVRPLVTSSDALRRDYGKDLSASLDALSALHRTHGSRQQATQTPSIPETLRSIAAMKRHRDRALAGIQRAYSETVFKTGPNWLERVALWPRITPTTVLELLQSARRLAHGRGGLAAVVQYGEITTQYQRLLRLKRALAKNDARRTDEETANTGHAGWRPIDRPDWLLLEIDADLLIRDEQVMVAQAMIAPASASNSVYQLNMGKGKTSMILPMVLAVLGDGTRLPRLIVPKALILPTAQVIQSRLGGLVGREARHVSFSRRLLAKADCHELVGVYRHLHDTLASRGGALIAAPEHILAFKMCGLQCLADGRTELALDMIHLQTRLEHSLCRDVLDESDFTLAVRTQLVYPSGELTMVDGAPHRWELVQALLALLEDHIVAMQAAHSRGINVVTRPGGGYPMMHILQPDLEDEIHRRIVRDIARGRVPLFRAPDVVSTDRPRSSSPSDMERLLERALTPTPDSDDRAVDEAASFFADASAVASGLLLVRGLVEHKILLTCLKKRWNVQYGLHPARWPIAVPFEARGVPSERSEFGHPDVSIIFTCLAFYYAGVSLEQFRQGLDHVLHHVDDPATEYERWASGDGHVSIPPELQHWNAINIDDQGQVEKLWTCLRFTRAVINHYLNTFVFAVHCRQFSVKLQASAWDLPICAVDTTARTTGFSAVDTTARTTGFSGTNDNKAMLPLTIRQQDLPGLRQTNAEVLTYLLQPRNRDYVCTGHSTSRWTEAVLVQSFRDNNIRVLIDAGAYILELDNETLARKWLRVADDGVKAAVFFDERDNRAWVVFRDASAQKTPLVSSPFADRLDECVVYFDEAHTRGVDLQLPPMARGALTLALGQTKDHTVQAAMRLRQLGSTQSVVFYAPPEVDQSIRDLCRQNDGHVPAPIQSPQVVAWLLEQTCKANEQLQPLYASHGRDFCRRTDALWTYRDTLHETESQAALLRVLERPERETLKVMYGSGEAAAATGQVHDIHHPLLRQFATALRHSSGHGNHDHDDGGQRTTQGAFEEVEQEREVEAQVEEEDVPDRRVKYKALSFPGLAEAIRRFVATGILSGDDGYEAAFSSIARTNMGTRYGVGPSGCRLYVSAQFRRTIKTPASGRIPYDDFLRPVEWLLWCPSTETGIVAIPEELELLLPLVRASRPTRVHVVAYAAAVTRAMLDFSRLGFYAFPPLPNNYAFPPWLGVEMGILAGRLYMTYAETTYMVDYLKGDDSSRRPFCADPAGFLLEWLPLRRTAQDIMHTPAAYICQGRPLRPDHAFFQQFNDTIADEPETPTGQTEPGMT